MDRQQEIIRFGNDGWQSRFDDGFTEENVVRVVDGLGLLWANSAPGATVYVGYDTRVGSRLFAETASAVLGSYGLRVRMSDRPCPTPAVGWNCAHDTQAIGGVIITASDKSCEYGGILIRKSDGGPLRQEFLDDLEQQISGDATQSRGSFELCDLMSNYIEGLLAHIDTQAIRAAAPSIVVDPMYGASSYHLADTLRKLGCQVSEIHAQAMPDFNGLHPIPVDPWADECEQEVVNRGASLGLILDGDADRASAIDHEGNLLSASQLVPLLMHHLVAEKNLSGRVITTMTCSASIERQANELGLKCVSVPVGFSRIYREVLEGDVLMGVEEYGGVCLTRHLNERDGLLVCLLLVELVCQRGQSLKDLVAEQQSRLGRMCYKRRDLHLDSAYTQAFRNILPGLNPPDVAGRAPVEVSHADGLRLTFADGSWVLLRPSRADAVVRLYAEAPTQKDRDDLLEAVSYLVKNGLPN